MHLRQFKKYTRQNYRFGVNISKICTHGLEKYTPDLGPLGRGTNGIPNLSVTFYLFYRSKYNKLLIPVHLG